MKELIEYCDNYSKTSGRLWQYYRDKPAAVTKNSKSFKSKISITWKCLSNFGRTLEMSLINFEIRLKLNWSKNFFISSDIGETKFTITDTELHVSGVTL